MSTATIETTNALPTVSANEDGWLTIALEHLEHLGCVVVEDVLDPDLIEQTREAIAAAQQAIHAEVGVERLERAGEFGVLRGMLRYDDRLFRLLEVPELLEVVDATVSPTAILHLQNGFVLPSQDPGAESTTFQHSFHRDYPRHTNGLLMSINALFAIDPFTAENGGTLVVPGTHQRETAPSPEYLQRCAVPVVCPAGSMIVFDSTLWHAAGRNRSGSTRLGLNQQFTRSYVKQQIDYVRLLGDAKVLEQQARTQQLLGWYTRVVTCLDEYYRPSEERLYRGGQG